MPLPSPPALFPSYLTNPLSYRRRKSSGATSTGSGSTSSTSPPPFSSAALHAKHEAAAAAAAAAAAPGYLTGSSSRLRCGRCLSDLALSSQIISKGFTGRHGRAYLVAPASAVPPPPPPPRLSSADQGRHHHHHHHQQHQQHPGELPNTYTHRPVARQLVTGLHTVGDLSCAQCGVVLGWKYVAAEEEAQRYKVGKFILEQKMVVSWGGWEGEGEEDGVVGKGGEEEVEFDSQDEDECEDLFIGVWTPELARRRRQRKIARGG